MQPSGTFPKPRSRPPPRRHRAAKGSICLSFKSMRPEICITIFGWRWRAFYAPGQCRKAHRWNEDRPASPSTPKIIRWTMRVSKGPFLRANTAPAPSWSGTLAPTVREGDPVGAYRSGKMALELHGKKLKGDWALVKTSRGGEDGKSNWLLIKSGSSAPPLSPRQEDKSALTGRPMQRIASDKNSIQWSRTPE